MKLLTEPEFGFHSSCLDTISSTCSKALSSDSKQFLKENQANPAANSIVYCSRKHIRGYEDDLTHLLSVILAEIIVSFDFLHAVDFLCESKKRIKCTSN